MPHRSLTLSLALLLLCVSLCGFAQAAITLPSGRADRYTTIRADTGATVEIRGVDLTTVGVSYISLEGLDMNAAGTRTAAVRLGDGTHHIRLNGNTIRGGTQYGIETTTTDGGSHAIVRNTIQLNGVAGGTTPAVLLRGPSTSFVSNVVTTNAAGGVQALGNNIVVAHNLIYSNATGGSATPTAGILLEAGSELSASTNAIWSNPNSVGVQIGATCSSCRAENNTIYSNGLVGLKVQANGAAVRNNLLTQNTTADLQLQGTGTLNQTNMCPSSPCPVLGTPTFQSTAEDNANFLKLAPGSRGVNEGTTLLSVPSDLACTTRPQPPGGAYDIGAYELMGGTNTAPTVAITSPTSSATYTSPTQTLTIGGTATDPDGNGTLAGVTWTCVTCTPSSGTATGLTTWQVGPVALASGTNVFTVFASDGALTGQDTLTVTWTPPSGNYYVTTTGNDTTGDGSSSAPWRTIGKALSVAASGTKIQVGPGTYPERLTPPTNGVTIQGTLGGGNSVATIIDGSSAVPGGCSWANNTGLGTRVWVITTSCLGFTPAAMTADGYAVWRIRDNAWGEGGLWDAAANLTAAPTATWDNGYSYAINHWDGLEALFAVNNGTVYVRFRNGESPATHTVRFAPSGAVVTISGRTGLILRDLQVQGGEESLVVTGSSSQTLLDHLMLQHGVYRLLVTNSANQTTLQNSHLTLHDIGQLSVLPGGWDAQSDAGAINTHRYFLNKFLIGDTETSDSSITLTGGASTTLIKGNTIELGNAGITLYDTTTDTEIADNTIGNFSDNAVYVNVGYSTATFHGNLVYNADHLMRQENWQNTRVWYVYANKFWQPYWTDDTLGVGKHIFLTGGSGGSSALYVYHNTFAGYGWALDVGGGDLSNVHVVNNVQSVRGWSSYYGNFGEITSNEVSPVFRGNPMPTSWYLPTNDPGRNSALNLTSRGWPGMTSLYYVDGQPDMGAMQGEGGEPPPPHLNPPSNFRITELNEVVPRSADLAWDYTQDTLPATAFRLYFQSNCTGTWSQQGSDLALSPLSTTVIDLATVNQYCWYLTAVAGDGTESAPSNIASQTVVPPVLNAPDGLMVAQFTETPPRSATLTWTYIQGTLPATAFRLYFQPSCTGAWSQQGSDLAVSPLSTTVSALPTLTDYCWYLTAVAADLTESLPSNITSHHVEPPVTVLNAPTNLQLTTFVSTLPRSATLGWQYVQGSDPAVAFRVYQQPGCSGPWSVATDAVSVTPPHHVTLTPLPVVERYCWYVVAVNASNVQSAPTPTLSYTVPAPPPPPPTAWTGTGGPAILLPHPDGPQTATLAGPQALRREQRLLTGLRAWWRPMPWWIGGTTWQDLVGQYPASAGWRFDRITWASPTRRGSHGEIRLTGLNGSYWSTLYTASEPFTVLAWAFAEDLGDTGTVAGQSDASSGTEGWTLSASNTTVSCGPPSGLRASAPITTGVWTHLACSWDGGSVWTLSTDGVQRDQRTSSTTFPAGLPLYLGSVSGLNEGASWNGRLDSVMLFGQVLSPTHIAALYDQGRAGDPDLLVHWSLLPVVGPATRGHAPGAFYLTK